ncbi:site-specific integrase [Streptosporangium vulgare]|uniref:site-specific integrase n=1 Tax=Streptosporangium vulgare TaxID=46190 RepID=UPI00336E422B
MLGADHLPIGPAEEYLEYLRAQRCSPNTVKSYARALALWWDYLGQFELGWTQVTLQDFGAFLTWLRTGNARRLRRSSLIRPGSPSRRSPSVAGRDLLLGYHLLNGVSVGADLRRVVHGGGVAYKPLLEHIARRSGRRQSVIRVRQRRSVPPTLTPGQIDRICDACASWDDDAREWRGSVRNRLLWCLLAETGLRLGEALGLQHQDWHTGRATPRSSRWSRASTRTRSGPRAATGDCSSPTISIVSTASTSGNSAQAGADLVTDNFDGTCVFVNLEREPRFAQWQPDSVS